MGRGKLIETYPEITQMIELVFKDIKIVIIAIFYMFENLKERLNMAET